MRFFVSPLCSDRRNAACHYDAFLNILPLGLLAFSAGYSQRVHLMLFPLIYMSYVYFSLFVEMLLFAWCCREMRR